MAFKFSLATVLRVRVIREEREEQMLQQILHKINQILRSAAEIDAEIEALNASRKDDLFKNVPGRQVHGSYGELQRLGRARKELDEQIEKLEQLKEMQFAVYAEARRDREMLTDMCERKHRIYQSEAARSEQKAVDDNYIARRGRF